MYRPALFLTALLAAGCEPPPTSELLYITFGSGELAPPVEVDTLCDNGGCDGLEQLEAELHFQDHDLLNPDAQVEILQYQVQYDLFAFDEEAEGEALPFYANLTSVRVDLGESTAFNVRAAGERQRDWVRSRFGSDQVDGVGTLTLAGFDHRNEVVQVDVEFDIAFGDFVTADEGGTR